jgi:hypothetical protein
VTDAEIRHLASYENETMNAECVQMQAYYFVDQDLAPSDAEIQQQFNAYKAIPAGDPNEQNPYGFGYELPDRLQLEYIGLKLGDVASVVPAPTQEEMETFYRDNRSELFSEQVPTDPNDPNSPLMDRLKNFSEVAVEIRQQLTRQKITTKAEQILIDARNMADANLAPINSRQEDASLEELEDAAGSYGAIAENLSVKHGVPLYSGRTGLLSAVDIQTSERLGQLFVTAYGNDPVRLAQLLFSIEALGERAVTLMSVPEARMFRSIGPAHDLSAANTPDLSDQIMALVRIVDVAATGAPESVEVTYSTRTLRIGDSEDDEDSVYSVKEQVIEDLRKLAAWDVTKTRAQEFIATATKDGWDSAVNQYNELYGAQAKEDPNDPNVFEVQYLNGLRRIATEQLQVIAIQAAGNPAAPEYIRRLGIERRFMDRLYSLIPADKDSLAEAPMLMEFKPDQSYYCLRSLSIQRLDQQQFQNLRPMLLSREERAESQSLSVVHFNPENILERMDFRYAEQLSPVVESGPQEPPEDSV